MRGEAKEFRACGRGGAMWASPPTEEHKGVRSCDGGAMHPKGTCFSAWASPPTKGQEVRW